MAWPAPMMRSVRPSGTARATIVEPIWLLPPGRLSTTICWPRRSASGPATMRPSVSFVPPGASGTTSRIGRPGWFCAAAVKDSAASAAASNAGSNRIVHPVSSWQEDSAYGLERTAETAASWSVDSLRVDERCGRLAAMQFGLFGGAQAGSSVPGSVPGQGFKDFVDLNIEAEALGYCASFQVEHHFTGWNQISATLNLLTWVAAKTTTLRVGTAVMVLPWHNPVLLAEQAATLDLLSGGRLDFGIGRGYRYNEFKGFALPMEEAEARFEEA